MKVRDYNKEPIVIKDYGTYFQSSLLMILSVIAIYIITGNILDGSFDTAHYYEFDFIRIVFVLLFIFWYIRHLCKLPGEFEKKPSFFKLTSDEIYYENPFYDKEELKIKVHVPIQEIEKVSFCVVAELPERHGRWHHLTSWQLYRQSSIGVHIGKATLYIRYLATYILFILPYKLWKLSKGKEPLSLLFTNFFIQFDNRNYFLINIYSKKDKDELIEYFKLHDIVISSKRYFIPHLQDHGYFVDKEEVWKK